MAKQNEYWQKRFKLIEEDAYKKNKKLAKEVEESFKKTLANINKDITYWYNRFANNNGLSYKEAVKVIKQGELDELGWDVDKYIKQAKLDPEDIAVDNASVKFHLTRLEAIKAQIVDYCEKMFGDFDSKFTKTLKETYSEGYYKTAYELAKGTGNIELITMFDEKMLDTIINKPWAEDGSNFSERIWGKYLPTLVNRLHRDLMDCIIRGTNPNDLTESYAKEFKTSLYNANTLIMTEYSAYNSLAIRDCMKDLDVEEFEVVETLDHITCAKCQDMDGKHYPMEQYEVGLTAPPFHPRCRGMTCPYFNDEFTEGEQRAARDPETGKTIYVDDMSYKEWKERFVKEKGQDTWDYYEKSTKNRSADLKQYTRYAEILGDNIPKTLEEFQKIKYNNSEGWADLKYYYSNIDGRPIEYVKIDRELEKSGITNKGKAYPVEDIEVKGWREHAEMRLKESNLTKEEALEFKEYAIFMMKRYPSPETQFNYFSDSGIIGIRANSGIVNTVIGKDRFDEHTITMLEVAKRCLKK